MQISRRVEVAAATTVVVVAIAVATAALVPSDERRTEVARTSSAPTTTTTSTAAASTTAPPATTTTAPAATVPAAARVSTRRTPSKTTTTTTTTSPPEAGWGHGLWVTSLDGSTQRRLGDWTGGSTWSPDGASLAFGAGNTIKVISARDGHQQHVLAAGTDTWVSCVDWSSTGDLAWLTHEGKVYVASHPPAAGRLVADNADGQGTESCAWSPDGRFLAVTGDALRVYTAQGAFVQHWKRDNDAHMTYGAVSWSADGSRIAAQEYDAREPRWHVAVVDPLKSALDPVIAAPDGRSIHSFAWHLDNERLYVQTEEARHAAHFLVRVDDRTSTTIDGVCCRRLRPLRDGRFLAYAPAYGRENKQIVVAGPDFQVERVVARAEPPPAEPSINTCSGAYFVHAVVSPDGTQVAIDASASYGPRCDSPAY